MSFGGVTTWPPPGFTPARSTRKKLANRHSNGGNVLRRPSQKIVSDHSVEKRALYGALVFKRQRHFVGSYTRFARQRGKSRSKRSAILDCRIPSNPLSNNTTVADLCQRVMSVRIIKVSSEVFNGTSRSQSPETTYDATAWPGLGFLGMSFERTDRTRLIRTSGIGRITILGHSLPRLRCERVQVLLGHKPLRSVATAIRLVAAITALAMYLTASG